METLIRMKRVYVARFIFLKNFVIIIIEKLRKKEV